MNYVFNQTKVRNFHKKAGNWVFPLFLAVLGLSVFLSVIVVLPSKLEDMQYESIAKDALQKDHISFNKVYWRGTNETYPRTNPTWHILQFEVTGFMDSANNKKYNRVMAYVETITWSNPGSGCYKGYSILE